LGAVAALLVTAALVVKNCETLRSSLPGGPAASTATYEAPPTPACGASDAKAALDDANTCYEAYQGGQIAQAESLCNRAVWLRRSARN
jgi:hypothetical protein